MQNMIHNTQKSVQYKHCSQRKNAKVRERVFLLNSLKLNNVTQGLWKTKHSKKGTSEKRHVLTIKQKASFDLPKVTSRNQLCQFLVPTPPSFWTLDVISGQTKGREKGPPHGQSHSWSRRDLNEGRRPETRQRGPVPRAREGNLQHAAHPLEAVLLCGVGPLLCHDHNPLVVQHSHREHGYPAGTQEHGEPAPDAHAALPPRSGLHHHHERVTQLQLRLQHGSRASESPHTHRYGKSCGRRPGMLPRQGHPDPQEATHSTRGLW